MVGGGIKCGSRPVFNLIHSSREYSVLAVFVLSSYIYCVVVVCGKIDTFNRGLWFSFLPLIDSLFYASSCFLFCFVLWLCESIGYGRHKCMLYI